MRRVHSFLITTGLSLTMLFCCLYPASAQDSPESSVEQTPSSSNRLEENHWESASDTVESNRDQLLNEITTRLKKIKISRTLISTLVQEILSAARQLSELDDSRGFEKIISHMLKMDWAQSRNQAFFDAIAARTWHRESFNEVFLTALRDLPLSSGGAIGRACSMFGKHLGKDKNRMKPEYTRELLSVLARIEERNVPEYTAETCEQAFQTHLLDPELRSSFLDQYREELNQRENRVLDLFLKRLQPPETDIPSVMHEAFEEIQWFRSYDEWREQHPAGQCDDSRQHALRDLDNLWAYRCIYSEDRFRRRYYFFPGRDAEANRLQMIRFSYPVTGIDIGTPLSTLLDNRLGEGERPAALRERGSAYWSETMSWETNNYRLLLFNNSQPARWWKELPQVEMLARSRVLIDWKQTMDRADRRSFGRGQIPQKEQLVNILKPLLPDLGQRLDQLDSPESILGLVNDLMEITPPDENTRAARLFLADRLATRLLWEGKGAETFDRWGKALSEYKVEFSTSYFGPSYNHIFIRKIREAELKGYWADEALRWILTSGRHSYFGYEDPAVFKEVIPMAQSHLKKRPDSHIRHQLLLSLARAHETGWALGHSSASDDFVDPSDYSENAGTHLKKAISYYRKLLDEYPDHEQTEVVRIKLRWLLLEVNTNNRYYYNFRD